MKTLEEIFTNTTAEQQIQDINDLGVFVITPSFRTSDIYIKTHKTVSKVNYMKLKKMNKGQYMKVIDFAAQPTFNNLVDLADISLKTLKVGEEKLVEMKTERLANKRKEKSVSKSYTRDGRTFASKEEWEDFVIDTVGYLPN